MSVAALCANAQRERYETMRDYRYPELIHSLAAEQIRKLEHARLIEDARRARRDLRPPRRLPAWVPWFGRAVSRRPLFVVPLNEAVGSRRGAQTALIEETP